MNSINLENFQTNRAIDMESMFYSCKKLTKLELYSFNTNNCINFYNIFGNCNNLDVYINPTNNIKLIEEIENYVNVYKI